MGVLKINCYCNEQQMDKIVNMVEEHLKTADRSHIAAIDDTMDDVRVCVEFETYMDTVELKTSELLDSDWDLLVEDSAVLTANLKPIVREYNRRYHEAFAQAHHILRDRTSFCI